MCLVSRCLSSCWERMPCSFESQEQVNNNLFSTTRKVFSCVPYVGIVMLGINICTLSKRCGFKRGEGFVDIAVKMIPHAGNIMITGSAYLTSALLAGIGAIALNALAFNVVLAVATGIYLFSAVVINAYLIYGGNIVQNALPEFQPVIEIVAPLARTMIQQAPNKAGRISHQPNPASAAAVSSSAVSRSQSEADRKGNAGTDDLAKFIIAAMPAVMPTVQQILNGIPTNTGASTTRSNPSASASAAVVSGPRQASRGELAHTSIDVD